MPAARTPAAPTSRTTTTTAPRGGTPAPTAARAAADCASEPLTGRAGARCASGRHAHQEEELAVAEVGDLPDLLPLRVVDADARPHVPREVHGHGLDLAPLPQHRL